MEYLIEGMFPTKQVHLIGGPSGAGKSTLMFQMYSAILGGKPFLGKATHPARWAYVSGDRPARSVEETQQRVGVEFPIFSLVDHDLVGESPGSVILPKLTKFYSYRPELIYIDGFTSLCPGGEINNYSIVAKWLASLQRYCIKHEVTIIGACHTTKTKEDSKFLNPRQRIAGSVAWAAFAETVLVIEPVEGKEHQRSIMVLPRNKKDELVMVEFDKNGILLPVEESKDSEDTADLVMEAVLGAPGVYEYQALLGLAENRGISRRSLDRWLARMVEAGKMGREKKGMYRVAGE